jgi:hypothetical protein
MREKGNKGVMRGIANPLFEAGGLQIRWNEVCLMTGLRQQTKS